MNKSLIIILLALGVGGGVILYFYLQEGEEKFTLANGVTGTAEELIAKGYIPVQVGNIINWVSKTEYDKALSEADGQSDLLTDILDAAGALIPIVKRFL